MVEYRIGQQVIINDIMTVDHDLKVGSIGTLVDQHETFHDVYLVKAPSATDGRIIHNLLSVRNFIPVDRAAESNEQALLLLDDESPW